MSEMNTTAPETTDQDQDNETPKTQHDSPDYIGQGTFDRDTLSNWRPTRTKLLVRGHSKEVLDFIYTVSICPKGHKDHMNQSAAAAKFFPNVSAITAKCRVLNTMLDLTQQIFSGQTVEDCQDAWDKSHAKPVSTGTRTRLSVTERATHIVTRELKYAFRDQNGVGRRGRLKPEVAEKMIRFIAEHMDASLAKKVAELEAETE